MSVDQLSAVFGALADPTRRAILVRLTEGDASVAELAEPFSVSQPAISRHLKVLETAGLISRRRRATARLSHLEAEPLRQATVWLGRYRDYWDESFDRLDELLADLQASASSDEPGQAGGPTRPAGPGRSGARRGPRAPNPRVRTGARRPRSARSSRSGTAPTRHDPPRGRVRTKGSRS